MSSIKTISSPRIDIEKEKEKDTICRSGNAANGLSISVRIGFDLIFIFVRLLKGYVGTGAEVPAAASPPRINMICVVGYDADAFTKFELMAMHFGIDLSKDLNICGPGPQTDAVIAKHRNGRPLLGFRVLGSILCSVPVISEEWMVHSFKQRKLLPFDNYRCNHRRVRRDLFYGLNVLFGKTQMPAKRLRTLFVLGGAHILDETSSLYSNGEKRVMLVDDDTDIEMARLAEVTYNCRVVSETWIVQCIYPNDNEPVDDNLYTQPPITKCLDFDGFDLTISDEESSSEGADMQSASESEYERKSMSEDENPNSRLRTPDFSLNIDDLEKQMRDFGWTK